MAKGNMIGGWAFLAGVILAIILGLVTETLNQTWVIVLVVIGIVVGLLNVADEEATPFLMSGAVLIIATSFGSDVISAAWSRLGGVLNALLVMFVPATIVVAIRNVFTIAKD